MKFVKAVFAKNPFFIFNILFLLLVGLLILRSIAPFIFPHYLIFVAVGILAFLFFSGSHFDILKIFSNHFYVLSLIFLAIPLIIGQVTRGTVRWIPIGQFTLQPSEIVRPFLILFFADFFTKTHPTFKRFILSLILLAIPLFLILIQPSFGVTVLTSIAFAGVVLASKIEKRILVVFICSIVALLPVVWFLLAPYQKQRLATFISPASDPHNAGYNSLQSMISVGSGQLTGRGIGEGVQTQLSFLPERHTDFIFASIAEELGFVGGIVLLVALFLFLFNILQYAAINKSRSEICFATGLFATLLAQVTIHIGMNMGMLPITGVPLPLVSAGGSSLLATFIALGMLLSTREREQLH